MNIYKRKVKIKVYFPLKIHEIKNNEKNGQKFKKKKENTFFV